MKGFRLLAAVIFACLSEFASLFAQQAKNVNLADFISTEELYGIGSFPYNTPDFPVADVWGWTYSGHEYALVCLGSQNVNGSGLAMVRVTDPSNIQLIKVIKRGSGLATQNGPRDVRVFGNYAYVSQDNANVPNYYVNLVTALNNPTNPSAGVTDFPTEGRRIHNLHINTTKGLLFLSDFRGNQPIPIYDINGATPVFKGQINAPVGGRSHDMTVTTTRVYDASTEKGLTITDYTYTSGTFTPGTQRNHFYNNRRGKAPNDFSSPTLAPIGHDATISTNGNYLFSADERNGGDTAENSPTRQLAAHLKIWDISNINALPDGNGFRYPIKKVYEVKESSVDGSFANNYFSNLVSGEFSNSIHNVHIRNESGSDIAYISYYTKGLRILNVANPLSPTEVGYYDTPGVSNYSFPVYNGPWGVYPFLPSGNILASATDGLYVFRKLGTFAGTINVNTRWSGTITVTDNVSVSSGVTLTVDPGTVVKFALGKNLTVNGTLQANGTSQQPITFTASGTSWNGIYFAQGSTGTLNYCTINKLTGGWGSSAITISNSTPTFQWCTIDVLSGSYVFGISVSGVGSGISPTYIFQSTIRSASGPTLRATSTPAFISIHDSDIIQTANNPAVSAENSGKIEFWIAGGPPYLDGKNKGGKLYVTGNALIKAGDGNGSTSHNHFCDAPAATLEVASGGTIYARYNYWPNGNPPTQINNGGTIYYSNNLGASNCSDVLMMVANATNETKTSNSPTDNLEELLFQAKDKVRAGLHAEAIELFIQIVESKQMPVAHTALLELTDLYCETRDASVQIFIKELSNQEGALKSAAMKMLADIYSFENNQKEALQLLDEITQLFPETPDAFFAQLSKFHIYFYEGQYQHAKETLDAIAAQSENDAISVAAARHLLSLETGEPVSTEQTFTSPSENFAAELATHEELEVSSYPNPFNPLSTIRFKLPAKSQVELKIYNILGQEVTTLVDRTLDAGPHEIAFDGSHLPSGIYLYRLEASGNVKSGKIILQK